MEKRARCLPGDQTGFASLGSLSVGAARRPWPILIEPTSPSELPDLRSELLRFPAGTHDDLVDALGLVGQLLDNALTGAKQPKPKEQRRDGYSDALEFMDRREVSILTDSFLTL